MAMRDDLGRWLFERDYHERGLATPDVATWDEYVEKNQEEWKQEADALLAESPAKSLTEFVQWVASLNDDVTLAKIIEKARVALGS